MRNNSFRAVFALQKVWFYVMAMVKQRTYKENNWVQTSAEGASVSSTADRNAAIYKRAIMLAYK